MSRGIISGILLYVLLWTGDQFLDTNTERILLNIDFLTRREDLSIWLELIPHLLISIVVYMILKWVYYYTNLINIAMLLMILIFILLYFLLSHRALFSEYQITAQSFTVWMAGHIIYLMIVYQFIWSEEYYANL